MRNFHKWLITNNDIVPRKAGKQGIIKRKKNSKMLHHVGLGPVR